MAAVAKDVANTFRVLPRRVIGIEHGVWTRHGRRSCKSLLYALAVPQELQHTRVAL
jgi:hypothetical protein